MSYSVWLKEKLLSIIKEMDRAPWLFARDPPRDFSRVKKWSLSETIRFILPTMRQPCQFISYR